MDRLEPVLKQKFWILLGVAILMTFIGWWMATGAMAALITQRQTDIENSFKSVPSGTIPNESWSKRLSAVNAAQDNSIKITQAAMWKRQLAKMTWPEGVSPVNGYWEKFPNRFRELFRASYAYEVENVWRMLHPVEMDGTGVVLYPYQSMYKVLKKTSWPVTPPESEEMWQIQEDLWLLEGLFQSITALNGGPDAGRGDAIIHQIDKLEFRGGGDKIKSAGGGGGGGNSGGMSSSGGAEGMAFGGMMPMANPGGGVGAAGGLAAGLAMVSAEFDPTEEFGDDGSGAAGGGGLGAMPGMMSMGADQAAPTVNAKPIERYILKDKSKPYKTRGFYLSVKMDHTKIPLLIEELTSNEKSVWPVEIVRVQMSRINEDDSSIGGRRSPMGGAGSSSFSMPAMVAPGMIGGSGGNNEESFNPFGGRGAAGEVNSVARVAFENALKDPVMAQVTVAGIFTLYWKVDEPAAPAPAAVPATPASPEDAVPAESAAAEPTTADAAAAGDKGTAATVPADGEPAMEGDEPAVGKADKSESIDAKPGAKPDANPDDKPEAKPGDKPEIKPEPNPDNSNR